MNFRPVDATVEMDVVIRQEIHDVLAKNEELLAFQSVIKAHHA